MTVRELFSIASLQFVFCFGFCRVFSSVSALTDSGQTVSCCRPGSEHERIKCEVQGSSLLLCLRVLLSVALLTCPPFCSIKVIYKVDQLYH